MPDPEVQYYHIVDHTLSPFPSCIASGKYHQDEVRALHYSHNCKTTVLSRQSCYSQPKNNRYTFPLLPVGPNRQNRLQVQQNS